MDKQRTLGAALSYAAQFVQIFVNLIYTPVMLRLVGQSEYGLYQMVYSVVVNLSLLTFGFSSAYNRFYFRCRANSDDAGIASLNGMFITVFSCLAVVAALAGSGLVFNIETILGSNMTVSEMSTARILMIIMVVNLVLTFPISVFDCYVTSQERFVFQKILIILQQILSPVITLPLLLLGYGSIAIISVATALSVANLLVKIYYCFAKLNMQISFRGFRFALLWEMAAFTFFVFLNQIIDQVNWSIDKFLLGRFVNTTAVAIYGVAGSINAMYLQFSTAISNVFVPRVNALVAQREGDGELTRVFTKVGRVQFFVMSLVLIGFISLGKPFLCLWVGKEYAESYVVALFLIVPVTIPLIQNLGIEIQRAKNMHQMRSIVYSLVAVGNILLSIPLIKHFGAVGASVGTAVSLLIGNALFMNWYYHKRVGLNMFFFWKEILSILPSLFLPCMVGAAIMHFASITNWLQFFICGAVIVLIYAFSVYMWGLNSVENDLLRSVVNSVINRFRRNR